MSKWLVTLKGEKPDLEGLAQLESTGWSVVKREERFYLTWAEFDGVQNPDEVEAIAKKRLPLVNGAALAWFDDFRPVELAGSVQRTRDDGTVESFESIDLSRRLGFGVSATVTHADGSIDTGETRADFRGASDHAIFRISDHRNAKCRPRCQLLRSSKTTVVDDT